MRALMLISLLLTGCGTMQNVPTYVMENFKKEYKTFGAPSSKRIILVHGIWSTDSLFDSGHFADLKNGFIAKGYQVVSFTCPWYDGRMMLGGGKQYRDNYDAFISWLISDLDSKYGFATDIIAGGFSFGGLHAMIAASSQARITKYIGMDPVSDPHLYPSLFNSVYSVDTTYFNAFNEATSLVTKSGIIVTSHDDQILGYQNAANLAIQIGSAYQDFVGVGGHDINAAMVTTILNQF